VAETPRQGYAAGKVRQGKTCSLALQLCNAQPHGRHLLISLQQRDHIPHTQVLPRTQRNVAISTAAQKCTVLLLTLGDPLTRELADQNAQQSVQLSAAVLPMQLNFAQCAVRGGNLDQALIFSFLFDVDHLPAMFFLRITKALYVICSKAHWMDIWETSTVG